MDNLKCRNCGKGLMECKCRGGLFHEPEAMEYTGETPVPQPLIKKHPILKFFKYDHLPERLQEVSKQFSDIAHDMDKRDLDVDEKTAGLRKLLEAKGCFVRGGV